MCQVTLRDFQPSGVAETCCSRSKVVAGLLVFSVLWLGCEPFGLVRLNAFGGRRTGCDNCTWCVCVRACECECQSVSAKRGQSNVGEQHIPTHIYIHTCIHTYIHIYIYYMDGWMDVYINFRIRNAYVYIYITHVRSAVVTRSPEHQRGDRVDTHTQPHVC